MTQTLAEYIKTHEPKGFKSILQYFPDGDYATRFLINEYYIAKRIDEHLTLYFDGDDNIIGYKIKGITILSKLTKA